MPGSRKRGAWWRATGGTAAIEFGFVLPVLLILTAGIIELGRALQAFNAVNRLASRIAIAWADCPDDSAGTCGTEMKTYSAPAAIQNLAPQIVATNLTMHLYQVSLSTGGTLTTVYTSTGAPPDATETALARKIIGDGNRGVVVALSYTHTLGFFNSPFFSFLPHAWPISYAIAQRK